MECLRSKIAYWACCVFLVFVIISAVRIGLADLLSGYAGGELQAWSSTIRPDLPVMDDVSRALGVARLIAPDNPDHHEHLARLALVRSGMPGISESERDRQIVDGLGHIRKAIALRPVSPFSWAVMLQLKRQRAEYDPEFFHGLERAVTLGPWEPAVQLIVADVGLSAWAALPGAEQEIMKANFARGVKHQAKQIISIFRMHRNACNGERAQLNAGCSR
jgi:hypothetical protein